MNGQWTSCARRFIDLDTYLSIFILRVDIDYAVRKDGMVERYKFEWDFSISRGPSCNGGSCAKQVDVGHELHVLAE